VSAELFTIPLEADRFLVYAPLRQAAFVANAATVNTIADLSEDIPIASDGDANDLVDFLRRLEVVDAAPEIPPISSFHGVPQPTAVTLFLTTACNLRCTYCYAAAGDAPARSMSLETAKRGIAFILDNAVRQQVSTIEVNYHGGGEPSANWRTMTGSLAFARIEGSRAGIGVRASAATNGVLNDAQRDWMIDQLAGVSLSFDGLPEVHDTHRPTVRGGGSSAIVMETMRRFDDAGFSYGVRVTVTADQIPLLAKSVAFILTRFNPLRVQVEPAFALGRWKDAPSAETTAFIDAYREAQSVAHSLGREIEYSAARLGTLSNHFCGVTQDTFALATGGQVSACYEVFAPENPFAETFFYGEPESAGKGYRFNLPVLDVLRSQSVEHREFCQGCFAKWTCSGDCYHKALNAAPGEPFAGSDRCHITRELTKDQILARIRDGNGLFWHEPRTDAASRPRGKEWLP